ncbi:hypothetical protein B0H12DRAFT_443805 [Mycena haematopus]|nr:hypothetical protein B0H12DRAFT_443805 [Mycena haematopus]
MADTLPDEIISEILSPALKVPEHMFSDLSSKSPFAKYSVSSSTALLVCKAWLRVATPLLYDCVVLRSKAQCRALHAALRKNPDLGRFIKKLRVEGGFSTPMGQILKWAPNIANLFLSLQIHSSDSSSGLVAGLPSINPTRLILFEDRDILKNKAVLQLMAALEGCVKKWTNMNTLVLPYAAVPPAREDFVLSLCGFTRLKIVSFHDFYDRRPILIQIAAIPTLEAIEIRAPPALKPNQKAASPPKSTDPRLNSLLRWTEDLDVPRAKGVYKLITRAAADPTFRPLSSTSQHKIWARILFFAMLPLEPPPKTTGTCFIKLNDRMASTQHLCFLLVSKLFLRLGLPYMYREPTLRQRSLSQLASRLSAAPVVGAHIHGLDISGTWVGADYSSALDTAACLARIFPYTPHLRRLVGNGSVWLTYASLCALGETAGATLEELSGISFAYDTGDTNRSPAILAQFSALRILAWLGASSYTARPFFSSADTVPTDALPALEFLAFESTEALPVFCQMQLPSLRRVSIHIRDPMLQSTPAPVTDFLRAHGEKILNFRTKKPIFHNVPVLTLCPNVTMFECRIDEDADFDLGGSKMDTEFQHMCLTTLVVDRIACHQRTREDQTWAEVFKELKTVLVHLPALREVRSPACQWPTTEHAISKSVWVQAAESLLKRGIKLKDKAEVEWRPRLKVTRR